MPTYKYRGKPLIYFGATLTHCALYGTSNGTMRFPHDKPPGIATLRTMLRVKMKAIEAARPRSAAGPRAIDCRAGRAYARRSRKRGTP